MKGARFGQSAAPIDHCAALMVKRQHCTDGLVPLSYNGNVGIVSEPIERCVKQGSRKHGRTQIADARGIDPVMFIPQAIRNTRFKCQLVSQSLAHFGAVFAF